MFEATTFWTTGITSLSMAMGQTLPKNGFERVSVKTFHSKVIFTCHRWTLALYGKSGENEPLETCSTYWYFHTSSRCFLWQVLLFW